MLRVSTKKVGTMSVADMLEKFEATQIAYVENRDGETGLTADDPRVASRVKHLMAIVISGGSGSWNRFTDLINDFEKDSMTK
jgi:hypothetical protein